VDVVIQSRSIDTGNELRDTHLRSADFFDTDQYPEIKFQSTAIQLAGRGLTIDGTLTMKGVTHPVVLTGTVLSLTPESDGRDRAEFDATTSINRLDYDITWNRVAEGGGMLLGDDVSIEIAVEAVRQPAAAPEGQLGGQ
jgi:polyisoprenoid-binding protein YceI